MSEKQTQSAERSATAMNTAGKITRYSDLFTRSRIAPQAFYLKGSRYPFRSCSSGTQPYPAPWWRLLQVCRRLELLCCQEYESSSPMNATAINRNFPFLDGGVFSREGDYYGGLKGAWVIGVKALRFVCHELGVGQPRRFRGEQRIPAHESLLAEVFWQQEETPEVVQMLLGSLQGLG